MNEECLICKAPLKYLPQEEMMECAICHTKEFSNCCCVHGHYVCSECHTKGMDALAGLCLRETSSDPIAIIEKMMDMPFCHMHGPEHHVMVGSALLTACKNAGGDFNLSDALTNMYRRGKAVPGGVCGNWGACGAAISSGIFLSIITNSSPLANEAWRLSNLMTSASLKNIGEIGGPRCCKRNSYTAILTAIDYVRDNLGIAMEKNFPTCSRCSQNNQCIGKRCPYSPANKTK